MEGLLTELKVIAAIRQHERVNSRGDILDIDAEGGLLPQGIRRFFSGECRDHNVSKVAAIVGQAVAELGATGSAATTSACFGATSSRPCRASATSK